MNINSESIKVFRDYMMFFEHAKMLKSLRVVSRGLVSPEFGNSQNILKRISSILLKGLRTASCLDISSILVNNFQKVKLISVTRQRHIRSNTDTDSYFTFLSKYKFTKFIQEDHYDGISVHVVNNSMHKERFAEALFGNIETEDITELLRTHEFVFGPSPALWNIGNSYGHYVVDIIASINEELAITYPNSVYKIYPMSMQCVLNNAVNGISWYTFRSYGEDTMVALYKKYCRNVDVRIPSIGTPENFNPVISDTTVRRMLDENRNHLLCNLSSQFRHIPDGVGLYLCRRFEDEEGECLAPNLIDGDLEYYWRCSPDLLGDPAAFYEITKLVNDKLKNKLVGIVNE